MNVVLVIFGRFCYWLGWPIFRVVLHRSRRSRGLIVSNNKALVVKAWIGNGKWSLPGGGVHTNETPKQGFMRELFEETGLVINKSNLRKLGNFWYNSDGLKFRYVGFVAQVKTCVDVTKQWQEIYQALWVDINELSVSNSNSDVLGMLTAYNESDTMKESS